MSAHAAAIAKAFEWVGNNAATLAPACIDLHVALLGGVTVHVRDLADAESLAGNLGATPDLARSYWYDGLAWPLWRATTPGGVVVTIICGVASMPAGFEAVSA